MGTLSVALVAGQTWPTIPTVIRLDPATLTGEGPLVPQESGGDIVGFLVPGNVTIVNAELSAVWTPGGANSSLFIIASPDPTNLLRQAITSGTSATVALSDPIDLLGEAGEIPYDLLDDAQLQVLFQNQTGVDQTAVGGLFTVEWSAGNRWWAGVGGWL